MTKPFSWSIDGARSGVENMAIDEALLEAGEGWLRFYTWSEPTLSLGYFQAHAARAEHPPSAGCALVRRSTGGGAILHDRELTYSLVVPRDHAWARDAQGIYDVVHKAIKGVLAKYGVAARLHGGIANCKFEGEGRRESSSSMEPTAVVPFLCFQRRSSGDLLLDDAKIAGSAQRRRKRAILQHGSILLAASPFAPELPGIAELSRVVIDARELAETLMDELPNILSLPLRPAALPPGLRPEIERAAREKFGNPAWTERR